MEHTPGVKITMAFRVPHGSREHWLNTWTVLGRLALEGFQCRDFQLRSGEAESAVVSEWESSREFDHFVRSSGIMWLQRASVHTGFIPDSVRREPVSTGQRAAVAAGA